jgi:outer membrane lipoprotein LolB
VRRTQVLGSSASLAALVFLVGCAQLAGFGPRSEPAADAFEMLGRVYVRYGERAFSGSLRWRHAQYDDEVWLGGPLGQTAAHIVRDSAGAVLTTADQKVYRSSSIEALTREGLGWSLPLADLSHYVLGKAPTDAQTTADATGRLASAQRDGWTVRWIAAEGHSASSAVRIDLSKADVEIRIVIDRLEAGAPS